MKGMNKAKHHMEKAHHHSKKAAEHNIMAKEAMKTDKGMKVKDMGKMEKKRK